MATLNGPIQFIGSIGGIRIYHDKARKKTTAATKGGQTRQQILTSPAFKFQRKHMNEFKICSKWASQLVKSLAVIDHLHFGYYFPKIVAMGKSIMRYDGVNELGTRSLQASKAPGLLKTINFNKEHPFDEVLTQQCEITLSEDKKTVTLRLVGFNSFHHLNWPDGYASYQILLNVAQLPDFFWIGEHSQYEPAIESAILLSVAACTPWSGKSIYSEDLIIVVQLPQPALQSPGLTLVVAVGVQFSSTPVEPNAKSVCGTGTMKILECFA